LKKNRNKASRRKHDKAILRSAKWYENRGYKVNADIPDYKKPKKIRGYIPDLIVKKGKKEIIVEIETKKTNKADINQQQAFKNYANQKKEAKFRKKVV